jgi:YrbI family 3-deoxy-D-manno-octulosonate 8-phosphate phosphatase
MLKVKQMVLKLPKTIRMVITDFDGVVTDNCVYINEDFTMSRKLNFKDIMGFSILKKNDFDIAIISGEKNSAIEIIAKKFKIEEIHQGIRIKIEVLKSIIEKYNLSQEEYVYIGDDINDLECLNYAKYKVTVPHAIQKVKAVKDIQITTNDAGNGAFREVADCLTD